MNNKKMEKTVLRFPPSPTGMLHIGSARTALFNYLFARHCGGRFLLRMEDTDKTRNKKEYEEDIIKSLSTLGISWDNDIWRQSERTEVYKKYLNQMIKEDKAYEAEDNKDGTGRVIRFKNPNKEIIFDDIIRGEIKFNTTELSDFVIARDINTPLYHITVVIDDFESGVTHIVRGEDGISNTPRQILLQEAIGAPQPKYAHIPLIMSPGGGKMSKRHNSVSVSDYLNKGYLPEAIINFLALLGWSAGDDREIYTMSELIEVFDISRVHKGGAVFNEEKLRWFNREHLKKVEDKDFLKGVLKFIPGDTSVWEFRLERLLPDLRERIYVYSDIASMYKEGEFDWLAGAGEYKPEKLIWKKSTKEVTLTHLSFVRKLLTEVKDADFTKENIKRAVWNYAESNGRGDVLWPFRYALTGSDKSPDPFTVSFVLGKEETLNRVQKAMEALG